MPSLDVTYSCMRAAACSLTISLFGFITFDQSWSHLGGTAITGGYLEQSSSSLASTRFRTVGTRVKTYMKLIAKIY